MWRTIGVTLTYTTSTPSAAPTMPTYPSAPAHRGNPFVWMTDPGVGPPFSSCTKLYSNALVCASHLHPSRGNSSRRSTRPSAQLHPNSWAFVRSFQILYGYLGVLPSVDVFLHFFEVKKQGKSLWVSFSGIAGRIILSLFQNS